VAFLSVCIAHLNFLKGWTVLNETWYELDAVVGHPTTYHTFLLPTVIENNVVDTRNFEVGETLAATSVF
jgi:hypothetical protein